MNSQFSSIPVTELLLTLKVKSRSINYKCNISMSNCPITLKFRVPVWGEYGSYGQITGVF